MNRMQKGSRGFSFIEVLTVIVIISLFLSMAGAGVNRLMQNQKDRLAMLELEQNLEQAMYLICSDIRKGTAISACLPDSIMIFTNSEIIQYSLEKDPQQKEHVDRLEGYVLYRKKSGQLSKQPMANFLSDLQFRYFDENGEETFQKENVRSIQVRISVQIKDNSFTRMGVARLSSGIYL